MRMCKVHFLGVRCVLCVLTGCMRGCSVVDGPRILDARVPRWGASGVHGRDDLEQRQDAVVRDAAERACVPAWACDDIPHNRRRDERGRDGDDGQRKLAAYSRVKEHVCVFACGL